MRHKTRVPRDRSGTRRPGGPRSGSAAEPRAKPSQNWLPFFVWCLALLGSPSFVVFHESGKHIKVGGGPSSSQKKERFVEGGLSKPATGRAELYDPLRGAFLCVFVENFSYLRGQTLLKL